MSAGFQECLSPPHRSRQKGSHDCHPELRFPGSRRGDGIESMCGDDRLGAGQRVASLPRRLLGRLGRRTRGSNLQRRRKRGRAQHERSRARQRQRQHRRGRRRDELHLPDAVGPRRELCRHGERPAQQRDLHRERRQRQHRDFGGHRHRGHLPTARLYRGRLDIRFDRGRPRARQRRRHCRRRLWRDRLHPADGGREWQCLRGHGADPTFRGALQPDPLDGHHRHRQRQRRCGCLCGGVAFPRWHHQRSAVHRAGAGQRVATP